MYEELELVPKRWLTLDEFEFWLTLGTAFFSSENIFPVLGEYSTSLE